MVLGEARASKLNKLVKGMLKEYMKFQKKGSGIENDPE